MSITNDDYIAQIDIHTFAYFWNIAFQILSLTGAIF